MVTIAHAVCDERGRKSGGLLGNQTQNLYNTTGELRFSEWYLSGGKRWDYVIRAKKKIQRIAIAAAACSAIRNPYIGYDQEYRNGILDDNNLGYNYPGDIKKHTACDCSSLVTACCRYARIHLASDVYTGNMKRRCEAVGAFKIYKSSKYTEMSSYLEDGDILLREGHHAAIVVNTKHHMFRNLKMGCTGEDVIALQEELDQSIDANLMYDGEFGFKTDKALRDYQTKYKLASDGIMGPLTAAHMGFLWR